MPVLVGPSSTASMAGRPSTLHLGALGDAVPSVGKPFLPYSEKKKKRPLFLRPIPETVLSPWAERQAPSSECHH